MVRLLDSPGDRDILAPMIEREILWRLITGPLGQSVRQIGLADSSLTHVSRAVRWISEHYDKPFRVEDLARSCGMSTSAFHRNFHAVTALSPIQFQKQIRLQKSRLLLLNGTDDVATAGYRVGYDSASQFSREYRRQFGLPPAATRLACGPTQALPDSPHGTRRHDRVDRWVWPGLPSASSGWRSSLRSMSCASHGLKPSSGSGTSSGTARSRGRRST